MLQALLVGFGGFLGTVLRYAVTRIPMGWSFPLSTLVVNVLGCFALGLLAGARYTETARAFVFIGVLGGFTTFSAFGNETFQLLRAPARARRGRRVGRTRADLTRDAGQDQPGPGRGDRKDQQHAQAKRRRDDRHRAAQRDPRGGNQAHGAASEQRRGREGVPRQRRSDVPVRERQHGARRAAGRARQPRHGMEHASRHERRHERRERQEHRPGQRAQREHEGERPVVRRARPQRKSPSVHGIMR